MAKRLEKASMHDTAKVPGKREDRRLPAVHWWMRSWPVGYWAAAQARRVGMSSDGGPGAIPPRTGRMGVSAAALVFETWGWLFREQPVEDYGIDAHVEPFDGPERPARQL